MFETSIFSFSQNVFYAPMKNGHIEIVKMFSIWTKLIWTKQIWTKLILLSGTGLMMCFLCPRIERWEGILFYHCPYGRPSIHLSVHLSFHLSAQT